MSNLLLKEMKCIPLRENNTENIVICDVQPEYKEYFSFSLSDFSKFTKKFNSGLVLYNGSESGYSDDSLEDITDFYSTYKIESSKFEYFDKGFGFLRDLIDNQVSDEAIVSSLKLFKNNGITSNNELNKNLFDESMLADYFDYSELDSYPFYIPDNLIEKLIKYQPFVLVGGEENACLAEIEILSKIFDLNFKLHREFIY